jgi:hypothetical protein
MKFDEDCDICTLEARGVKAVQMSVLEESDVVVCERHLRMLREMGDSA